MNSIEKLGLLLDQVELYLPQHEALNSSVSSSPVGWHIEHSLLVINQVIGQMIKSDPTRYKKRFDYRRYIVLVFGYIPRGKIRAPKAVQPAGNQDAISLQSHLDHTRQKLLQLANLGNGHYFTHPFLGDFRVKPATRFLCVHTRHHLDIIREILNKE